MSTVTVVGGGPAGLQCAICLRDAGVDVTVIEEHNEIGLPEACSGLISVSGTTDLSLDVSSILVNQIYGARIVSPEGDEMIIERRRPVAHLISRLGLDRMLAAQAVAKGAELRTGTQLMDIRKDSLFMKKNDHGEFKKTRFVVGADGPTSTVRQLAKITPESNRFIHGFQVTAEGNYNPRLVEVHLGSFAPGFFAWIIPENEHVARVGLGARLGSNITQLFDKFVLERRLEIRPVSKLSGLIPLGPPIEEPVAGNILLAGDAAFHTKATTGGGIMLGMKAAQLCAQSIIEHLNDKKPLKNYAQKLKPIHQDLKLHWKIYNVLQGLSPARQSALFRKAKKAGLAEFLAEHGDMDKPSAYLGKALAKPAFWGMAPDLIRLLV